MAYARGIIFFNIILYVHARACGTNGAITVLPCAGGRGGCRNFRADKTRMFYNAVRICGAAC